MTTARTVAPNHGGRANTRGRAVVASFNAADARSSVPVPQDSGREVDSPVSVVQRSAWNCVSVIPGRINARPAAPTHSPIVQARSMGLCAVSTDGVFFFGFSALVHGVPFYANPFTNTSERFGAHRNAV